MEISTFRKSKFLLGFIALVAALTVLAFFSQKPLPVIDQHNVEIAEQEKQNVPPTAALDTLPDSLFGQFTTEKICMAITNAMAGSPLSSMKTSSSANQIIVSVDQGSTKQLVSYNCKHVENRFYWRNASSVFSQSILEVEPQVNPARKDILKLYLYEPRDISNIVRHYSIDDFS